MNQPLVSVIIPTYNRSAFLEEAIVSVVNQNYENIEIIVVDDGSDLDYANAICKKYPNCQSFKKVNGGLSSARNFGIKQATGKYIALLDDDDLFLPSKIEKQVQILEKYSEFYCVHAAAAVIDEKGVRTGQIIGASAHKAHKRHGYVFWNALGNWVVKSPTPLFRKEVFDKILFDETIKVGEDLDFYWRLFYLFKVYYVSDVLAFYRDCNDIERLSKKEDKYIGVEGKTLDNLRKMKVKNFFVFHRIKIILAKSAVKRWNKINDHLPIKVNSFSLYFFPEKFIFFHQEINL